MIRFAYFVTLLLVCIRFSPSIVAAQSQSVEPESVNFGEIVITNEWQHTFHFENKTSEAIEVKDVQLTPPLLVTNMTARVEPGGTGNVTVSLGNDRENGDFRGTVTINFKNQASGPKVFEVVGRVVPAIEFVPFPMFFVSTLRNQPKTASIELINHQPEPLEIQSVKHTSSRYTTELQTLEPGRRYHLALMLRGDGSAGRMSDTITLATSSRDHPLLKVFANTNVNERVHTFPDAIDFGMINIGYLKTHADNAGSLTKQIMVYQEGGNNFQISAQTDLPFLQLSTFQAQLRDRYELRAAMIPERLKAGTVNGAIVIVTSDPEFRRVTIPVKAIID
jgi:hypothetical protein